MEDIVNELRDRSYASKPRDPLCERAADEIESLRRLAVSLANGNRVPLTLAAALLECKSAKEQGALVLFDIQYGALYGDAPGAIWSVLLNMLKELR